MTPTREVHTAGWRVRLDLGRQMLRLGWRTTTVDVEYRVPPTVLAVESSQAGGKLSADAPPVLFSGAQYELAAPVMAEVYVERLKDREGFQRKVSRVSITPVPPFPGFAWRNVTISSPFPHGPSLNEY